MENKMILAGLIGLLVVLVAVGNLFWEEPETEERYESTRVMMNTYVKIVVYHKDEGKAREAIEASFARMEEIESIASRFNSSSELYRLNSEGIVDNPSRELVELMEISIHYCNITGGAFDVTILPLLDLWSDSHYLFSVDDRFEEDLDAGVFPAELRSNFTDFSPALYELNGTPTVTGNDVPGPGIQGWTIRSGWQEYSVVNFSGELKVFTMFWNFPYWSQQEFINLTMPYIGSDMITIEEDSIGLEPGMAITLDGVAKGYAVDAAITVLEDKGIERGLVNAGGDIATLGTKPNGEKWLTGLRNPEEEAESVTEFELSGQAIATSGNYERYFNESHDVGHIMDPGTGRDVMKCSSASVIADNCTVADIMATALFVLGPVDGITLVDGLPGIEALLLGYDDPRELFPSSELEKYEI